MLFAAVATQPWMSVTMLKLNAHLMVLPNTYTGTHWTYRQGTNEGTNPTCLSKVLWSHQNSFFALWCWFSRSWVSPFSNMHCRPSIVDLNYWCVSKQCKCRCQQLAKWLWSFPLAILIPNQNELGLLCLVVQVTEHDWMLIAWLYHAVHLHYLHPISQGFL